MLLLRRFVEISIHSPHARGDKSQETRKSACQYFNPLPSYEGRRFSPSPSNSDPKFQSAPLMRGETHRGTACAAGGLISIRSPLTRGDPDHQPPERRLPAISIHSPHTRGDLPDFCSSRRKTISIHSPHTRGDAPLSDYLKIAITFQSTPLTRGETSPGSGVLLMDSISIHSPHTRGDLEVIDKIIMQIISIHSPHTRGDH